MTLTIQEKVGYTNIPNDVLEYIYGSDLSGTAIKLILLLWKHRNTDETNAFYGLAWPSNIKMKQTLSVSASNIKPAREELIDKGLISVHRGVRGKLYYHFNMDVSTYKQAETKEINNLRVTELSGTTTTESSGGTTTELSDQRIPSYNNINKDYIITAAPLENKALVSFEDLFG